MDPGGCGGPPSEFVCRIRVLMADTISEKSCRRGRLVQNSSELLLQSDHCFVCLVSTSSFKP